MSPSRRPKRGRDRSRDKSKGGRRRDGNLPSVIVIEVFDIDEDGDLLARPLNWDRDVPPPPIRLGATPRGRSAPNSALAPGHRALVRLSDDGEGGFTAQIIRRLSADTPADILGIFGQVDGTGRVQPIDKRAKGELIVRTGDAMGAEPGQLVRAQIVPGRRLGLRQAKVVEKLGRTEGPKSISLIAVHDRDIPVAFSDDAIAQAEQAGPAPLDGREDLRAIPLVTIDGADARDFDDAVWAEPDDDPKNAGGWHLLVAIADVSWYVRPGDALDADAYERGNSVYFPDRVIPMLPEALSNGWCSLVPQEDRPCLAVHMWIDRSGNLLRHRFVRGLMRSSARLTYEQVHTAKMGEPDAATEPLRDNIIANLYGAYEAMDGARRARNALELQSRERRIELDDDGRVSAVTTRQDLPSHRLIEEFMVTANVAAAETLEAKRQPCMYRVHDQPPREKLESLSTFLDSIGMRFAKGQVVKPLQFNQILKKAAGTPNASLVNDVVLRSQAQAEYSPNNIGHFGLALRRYCHFTSPIRRYPDLLVHRALINGLKLGDGGLETSSRDFTAMGQHLSDTERRAAMAERDAMDRYVASYLTDRVGSQFRARISGATRFGLFVNLEDSGADGLIPIRALPEDYYHHDEKRHTLTGRRQGRVYRLGDDVEVILREANPITGGLILDIVDGGEPPSGRRTGGPTKGKKGGRKTAKSGKKRGKRR